MTLWSHRKFVYFLNLIIIFDIFSLHAIDYCTAMSSRENDSNFSFSKSKQNKNKFKTKQNYKGQANSYLTVQGFEFFMGTF